jgi:hypothetical protein
MAISAPDESQRMAARVAGFSHHVASLFANFAEFYVPAQIIVYNNAATTARNIMAHERLFRLGVARDLIVFALDVVRVQLIEDLLMEAARANFTPVTIRLGRGQWRIFEQWASQYAVGVAPAQRQALRI